MNYLYRFKLLFYTHQVTLRNHFKSLEFEQTQGRHVRDDHDDNIAVEFLVEP